MKIEIKSHVAELDYSFTARCAEDLTNPYNWPRFLVALARKMSYEHSERGEWTAHEEGLYLSHEGETDIYLLAVEEDFYEENKYKGTLYYSDSL